MSERKINLQNILSEKLGDEKLSINEVVIKAMKEVCKQLLELAAENAYIERYETGFGGSHYNECKSKTFEVGQEEFVSIDKQSILDTINQVE